MPLQSIFKPLVATFALAAVSASLARAESERPAAALPGAAHPDVSFLVVGKSSFYQQDAQGRLGPASYYLFSEVFLRDGGKASSAVMTYPGGKLEDFSVRGSALRIQRRDFATRAELDRAFPDGTYAFEVATPGGDIARFALELEPRRTDPYPRAIRISFEQSGKAVAQGSIDPQQDLIISWTDFGTGRADPRGILGDVAFVIMTDCKGGAVARSELPFKETPSLSYADREFRVPAERLHPRSVYKLLVEHAELVDVVNRDGIVGLATYPAVTNTVLSTRGASPQCN